MKRKFLILLLIGLFSLCGCSNIKNMNTDSLLNELAYDSNYNNAKGKIYIKDNNIYKIIYEIDDLTITATFFRINNIRKPDIGQ